MLKEEKWDFGLLGIFFLTIKLLTIKNEKLPFKTNIPTFQHSNIPTFQHSNIPPFHYSMCEVKTPSLNKPL